MAQVVRVVDGDTIVFSLEASAANSQLLAAGRACLEKDISERDRYGRLLRYVWLSDGRLVEEELLREGFAALTTFPPDIKYIEERYLPALREARGAGRGIWTKTRH